MSVAGSTRQRGVGLVEILLAVVLVSVGFLAAARMQVESMRFSKSAYHQSQAYLIAADMIDRMRGNPKGVEAGHYAKVSSSVSMAADLEDPGCDEKSCGPAETAAQDLYDWSGHVHDLEDRSGFVPALPSSTAHPAGATILANADDDGDADGTFTITVVWSEAVGRNDTEQSVRVDVAL